MGVGFDLEGGVSDVVSVLEDAARPVEYRVGLGHVVGHDVDSGDVHLGGESPHMKVMNIHHACD